MVQAKGAGYAISQSDELQVVKEVAEATGQAPCLVHKYYIYIYYISYYYYHLYYAHI